jgi:uncharacterized membrane protein YozB (DUF420 family)
LDPKLVYWTWALINMVLLLTVAASGVRAIRRRRVEVHRRRMLAVVGLVGLFLASYPVKVVWLGRESLDVWSASFVYVLRIHEACVLAMVLSGCVAFVQAQRVGLRAGFAGEPSAARARGARLHRRAGWVALISGALGVVTASYVLAGMYLRA